MPQHGIGSSNSVENVFTNKVEDVSGYNSLDTRSRNANLTGISNGSNKYITKLSEIPIKEARSNIFYAESIITPLLNEIDLNLDQVNINSSVNIELETAHKAVWKTVAKNNDAAKGMEIPAYIPYREYVYALNNSSSACRNLVKNYDLSICYTSFGHLIDIRKILLYIKNEIGLIRNIIIYHYKDEYRDETEAQIARYLSDWAKTATHYVKLLAKEITGPVANIPQSEIEKIDEKYAAQFQSFFSLKVNSYMSEIRSILNVIKRDCVDMAQNFYGNYLLPAMSYKSLIVEPLVFDFSTSTISADCPTLMGEMVMANNAVTGNLGSITTDFIERRIQFSSKMDAILELITLMRRYANYISQLELIAIQRVKIIFNKKDEDLEKYQNIFDSTLIDSEARNDLSASHSKLDDLDEDAHPQYLRKDGGTITGKIELSDKATIAGINLGTHSHSGLDGSSLISAKNIDYTAGREEYYSSFGENGYSNIILTGLNQSNLIGGGLYFDATFKIEIDNDKANSYEFEILYNEI